MISEHKFTARPRIRTVFNGAGGGTILA